MKKNQNLLHPIVYVKTNVYQKHMCIFYDINIFYQAHLNSCSEKPNILTDFKNATLTSLYIFQNTVVCKIPLLR